MEKCKNCGKEIIISGVAPVWIHYPRYNVICNSGYGINTFAEPWTKSELVQQLLIEMKNQE